MKNSLEKVVDLKEWRDRRSRQAPDSGKASSDSPIPEEDFAVVFDDIMFDLNSDQAEQALREKRFDEAVNCYTEALSFTGSGNIKPRKIAAAYLGLGNAFYLKGFYDSAIENYKKSIELFSRDANVYISLGHAYKNKDDLDSAEENYRRAVSLRPEDVIAGEIRLC